MCAMVSALLMLFTLCVLFVVQLTATAEVLQDFNFIVAVCWESLQAARWMGAFLPPHCWFLLFFGKRTHSLGRVLHEGEFFVWSGYMLSSLLQFVRKNRIKDISTASSIAQKQDEQVFLLNLEELTPYPLCYKEYWHCHSVLNVCILQHTMCLMCCLIKYSSIQLKKIQSEVKAIHFLNMHINILSSPVSCSATLDSLIQPILLYSLCLSSPYLALSIYFIFMIKVLQGSWDTMAQEGERF